MNEEETNLFTRPGGLFFPPGSLIVTLNVWEGRERVANAGFNPLAEDKRYLDWLNWRYIIFMPKKYSSGDASHDKIITPFHHNTKTSLLKNTFHYPSRTF